MEEIAAIKETAIPLILERTIGTMSRALERNRTAIEGVSKKTFSFGPAERNQVDIYYPAGSGAVAPLLVFIYGGGFTSGERAYPPPLLAYGNLGAFFARRGFFVAIPDYTLVPPATFPQPPAEIRDAIVWIVSHADEIAEAAPNGSKLDIYAIHTLGHSAGGTHLATTYLLPTLVNDAQGQLVRNATATIVLSGAALNLNIDTLSSTHAVRGYYGADLPVLHPLGLLENASADILRELPRVVIVQAEREYDGLEERIQGFKALLERRMAEVGGGKGGWKEVAYIQGRGHNHISINWALSTGEGEDWADELIALVKSL